MDLDVRGHAVDEELLERRAAAGDGRRAIRAPDDELAEQRVVVRRHLVARVQVRVHPDARPAGRVVALDDAGAGPEVVRRVLGVDPELDCVPAGHDVRLPKAEWLSRRDPDLERDEVDAGEHLGDRVLDLDAAVDLDEVRGAGAVDEELERPDVLVARGHDRANRLLGEGGARLGGERRRRALLEDLLVAALHGAVALAEVDAGAEAVDRDLDLHVPVVVEPLLEVQRVVAERGLRLGAADLDRRLQLPRGPDHAHALAAAAGGRLDQHRVADPVRLATGRGRRR